MDQHPPIVTRRLELVPLSPSVIRAILRGDTARTAKLLNAAEPCQWRGSFTLLEMRLRQMMTDPPLIPWLLRAMVHRETRALIGHIGFHTGPNPAYLRQLGLDGIEYGYTVFEPHRRQGYAKEAAAGLMRWARESHGVSNFVLSIAPTNEPSLRVAKAFGFTYHSVFQDPEDGVEHIYTAQYLGNSCTIGTSLPAWTVHYGRDNPQGALMYEQVLPDVHRIEVPLPNTPLKSINCYLLRGPDRWLLIDTGMHRPVCREALETALNELRVDLHKTDFFITHLHSDHIGQLDYFATPDSTVYFNRIEAPTVTEAKESGGFGEYIMNLGHMTGFSEQELNESLANHPGGEWNGPPHVDFALLDEGDTLQFGEFSFAVIHTPGHSPGHLCLYDADRKLMVAGDHVLAQISPNISPWGYDDNPLTDFLNSLDKVRRYDVELALPGHRRLITNWTGRIDELKQHHDRRLDEIVRAVNGTAMTPYEIASHMTWDMKYDTWDDVNVMQKWFAAGEATAHLRHLESSGAVTSAVENGVLQYWAE